MITQELVKPFPSMSFDESQRARLRIIRTAPLGVAIDRVYFVRSELHLTVAIQSEFMASFQAWFRNLKRDTLLT